MVEQNTNGKLAERSRHVTEIITDLFQSYLKLGVVHLTDKGSGIVSVSIVLLVSASLALFVLFFLGIGIGFWLGQQLNSMLAGFGIVATFFLVLAISLFATRNRILIPFIRNLIIAKVYE
jgi:uncharacterized membrane protein YqjE